MFNSRHFFCSKKCLVLVRDTAKTLQIKNLFYFLISGHLSLIFHQASEREVIFHAAILTIKKGKKEKKIVYQFKMFTLTCKHFGIKIFFVL